MGENYVSYTNATSLMTAIAAAIGTTRGLTATEFSDATAYDAGDVVVYNGSLYKFTAAHAAGAWTGSDAQATTAVELIESAGVSALTSEEVTTLTNLLN